MNSDTRLEKLTAMPSVGRLTSKENVYLFRLDKKNALFFSIEENNVILLSNLSLEERCYQK